MIPRYSRPQLAATWAPENRFRIWFEIEAHACDARAEAGALFDMGYRTKRVDTIFKRVFE